MQQSERPREPGVTLRRFVEALLGDLQDLASSTEEEALPLRISGIHLEVAFALHGSLNEGPTISFDASELKNSRRTRYLA